jgi:threonine/homoserine/homoserine lactone efflux protein
MWIKVRRGSAHDHCTMTDEVSFMLGALALLATPGPTNTLLATSGATCGFRKSLVLLCGELLGYLIAIAVLIAAVTPIVALMPGVGFALRIAAGLYLLRAAWKLWQHTELTLLGRRTITIQHVFVTTLLNPKAIIFAFTLIPFGARGDLPRSLPWLVILSLLIVIIGTCWIAAGAVIQRNVTVGAGAQVCCRAGAIALMLFAALIGGSALTVRWQ